MKNKSLPKAITFIFIFLSVQLQAASYNILDFGARANDSIMDTKAINNAVKKCNENGGGTVLIPSGIFITGTIVLQTNVNLHLEAGAELFGSSNVDDYRIFEQRRGIVYCEDAYNVSISGKGTINAGGIRFYETDKNHVYNEFDKSLTRQKDNYMPEGVFFTDGPLKRKPKPGMTLVFFHCTKVSLSGITIKDTPSWATRFGYCEDVLIEGIKIQNNILIPNSDGIHLTASRNIRISDCNIIAGDDAIVMTGFPKDEETPGFTSEEQDKHIYGNKSEFAENLTVSNCILKSSSSGIRVGYGQHPIRRCIFSNIIIYDSHRGIGIFAHDASDIEDLIFTDIFIETKLLNGQWWGHGEPIHLSCISRFEGHQAGQIKNVQFNNINAVGEQGIILYGLTDSQMENIRFNNIQLLIRTGRETLTYGGNFDLRPATPVSMQIFEHDIPGIYAQYVTNLEIRNFALSWGKDLPDFFTHGIECKHVNGLFVENFEGSANPNSIGAEKIHKENTTYRKNE